MPLDAAKKKDLGSLESPRFSHCSCQCERGRGGGWDLLLLM